MIGRRIESFVSEGQSETFYQIVVQFLIFRVGKLRRDQTSQPFRFTLNERFLLNMSNGERNKQTLLIFGPIQWDSQQLTQNIARERCVYKMSILATFLHSCIATSTPTNNE